MDNIKYNQFKNICRTCLINSNLKSIQQDNIIINVLHNLGVRFEINDELPQQICLKCYEKINEIHEFTLKCKLTYSGLMECLNNLKTNDATGYEITGIKVEMTNENDKITNEARKKTVEKLSGTNEYDVYEVFGDKSVNDVNELSEDDSFEENSLLQVTPDINVENVETSNFSDVLKKNVNSSNDDDDVVVVESGGNEERSNLNDVNFSGVCITCKKTFSDEATLKRHECVAHIGECVFKCYHCSTTFTELNKLKEHILAHSNTPAAQFQCEICAKSFADWKFFEAHKKIHMCELPYECDVCDKKFSAPRFLAIHKKAHRNRRSYKCETCAKLFTIKKQLLLHRRIHGGDAPHTCPICDKAFVDSSTLRNHKVAHTNKRPFKCDVCTKTYKSSSVLAEHKKIHTGERKFVCEVCNKMFIKISDLKRHKITHITERPYKCDVCNKGFLSSQQMNKHKTFHERK